MKTDPHTQFKVCKTVGALIRELEKLPKRARLSDPLRPVFYNQGKVAREMGLTPQVGFEEEEEEEEW